MMVETILESSQDFGTSNGALPQWKRELLQRRAARSRPAAAPAPPPPPPPLPPPPPADDDSEELRYGPGIVKRLKSRYLSLALRDAPRRRPSVLRRAASLEHLLDERPPPAPRHASRARPAAAAAAAPPPPRAARREEVKRARSVDALSRLDSHEEPAPPSPSPPPPPAAPRSARPPRRPAPLLRDAERPPPDVVRSALRKFESAPPRRAAGAARVSAAVRGLEGARRSPAPEPQDGARSPSPPDATDAPVASAPSAPPAPLESPPISVSPLLAPPLASTPPPSIPPPAPSPSPPTFPAIATSALATMVPEIRAAPTVAPPIEPVLALTPSTEPAPALTPPPEPTPALTPPSEPTPALTPPPEPAPALAPPSEPARSGPRAVSRAALEGIARAGCSVRYSFEAARGGSHLPPLAATNAVLVARRVGVIRPMPAPPRARAASPPAPPAEKPAALVNGHSRIGLAGTERAWSGSAAAAGRLRSGAAAGRLRGGAAATTTSVVFNFSDRKEVPDYIENDGLILRASRRNRAKSGADGAADESDSSGEEAPPSPCAVRFVNDNVLINGRSSMPARADPRRGATLKLQFDDSLTRTFEYPSETSLCEDAPDAPAPAPDAPAPADSPATQLADNTHMASAALSRYTPSKTPRAAFQLGVTRRAPPPPPPSPPRTPPPAPPHGGLAQGGEEREHAAPCGVDAVPCGSDAAPCGADAVPCGADAARSWSEARTLATDLLF